MSSNYVTKAYEPSPPSHYVAGQQADASKCWNSLSGNCDTPATSPTQDNAINGVNGGATTVGEDLPTKLENLKRKFHRDRKLLVKHLPRNVAKPEIAQLLKDFAVETIQLSSNDDKSSTATVSLADPAVLDEWNGDRTFLLRGQSVSVSPTPTEMVLCVAKLPFHYGDRDFYELIKAFGDVKMYFLMVSEKTGRAKGYGFVRYASKESALSARNALNDKLLDTLRLACDWLDSSHLTFRSLHSSCLYVDRLPPQFRDMGEFRTIFERIVKPPYCQIALRNGCPLDWGLVEYLSPDDAELAQTSCNRYRLRGQPIRVVYFIPGVRAITLMLNLLDTQPPSSSSSSRGGKSTAAGLLPDPSGQSIRMSIENLSKQNPIFAENLKSIILHQIQESQQAKDGHEEVAKSSAAAAGAGGRMAGVEPKTLNGALKHLSARDVEKMVPPTPPMTPTILSTLPLMSSAGGLPAPPPPPPSVVPVLPNTAVPPPSCAETVAYAQPSLAIAAKDKTYAVTWNDLLGQAHFANGFLPAVPSAAPDATLATATAATVAAAPNSAFAVHAAPVAPINANIAHEILNLPLNVQQNILNIVNNSSGGVSLPVPNVVAAAQPQSILPGAALPVVAAAATAPAVPPVAAQPLSFSSLAAVDPTTNWLLQHQRQKPLSIEGGATLVTTPLGPPIMPMPIGSKGAVLQNWPSVASFVPTPSTVPLFATSGADWQNIRLHPQIVATVSQPSTPVSHHYHNQHHYAAGQKRKLLPSPEKSPEGNYIGQHSQGIGGHYADSYFKKKKMF